MKVSITSRRYNPLLKRKEITFQVQQDEMEGTSSRFEARKRLASLLENELNLVYIQKMETMTGTLIAVGSANIYDDIKQAQLVEPKHIISRNTPEKRVQKEE